MPIRIEMEIMLAANSLSNFSIIAIKMITKVGIFRNLNYFQFFCAWMVMILNYFLIFHSSFEFILKISYNVYEYPEFF
ncbi:MAG: hypothetical protein ABIE43_00990 [Patescibacteria group bacterium]